MPRTNTRFRTWLISLLAILLLGFVSQQTVTPRAARQNLKQALPLAKIHGFNLPKLDRQKLTVDDQTPHTSLGTQERQEPASDQSQSLIMREGSGFVLYADGDQSVCRNATPQEARALLQHAPDHPLHFITTTGITPQAQGGLTILLRGTQQLENFPAAKAAFIKAAANWQAVIQNPITLVIDVDFGPTRFGQPYPSGVIGSTDPQEIGTATNYTNVRTALLAGAANQPKAAIYNALPSGSVPTDLGNSTSIFTPTASYRALGIIPPVATPETEPTAWGPPPSIGFNSNFAFDFDPSNGIDPDKKDFDAVVTHELGHVLGFTSTVGNQDLFSGFPVAPSIWDLFRLRPGAGSVAFTTSQRILSPGGNQVYFFGNPELALSTARSDGSGGDGRQASHWKDDDLTGQYIGIMDPTLPNGKRQAITANDLKALDSMGYQISSGDGGTTEILSTDDGTAEGGFVGDGEIFVNRLSPSKYPATLQTIRIFFQKFSNLPSPTGAQIKLIAFVGSPGTNRPPNNPVLFLSQTVTLPTIPASGGFIDFPIANGPTITSGDFYIGFQSPNPFAGVGASIDSNGSQQQRGFFSTNNGATYQGPAVAVDQQGTQFPVNLLIQAIVASSGSNCTFSISPSSQLFSASGGTGTVNVTTQSGCDWTATSNNSSFITINSGGSSSGNGTVNYTVAPNTGTSQRTGTLTIAGQTFTIIQAGTGSSSTTETLSTDDGNAEGGFGGSTIDGYIFVNRLTPSKYPATLQTIRIFFWKFMNLPSPTGAQIKLLAFAGSPGTERPPDNPSLLFSQTVTIPTIPSSGGFIDFPITNGPTINSGDFYIGFQVPNPAAGVGAWFDSNGPQQQRGFFSNNNGATYGGPITTATNQPPVNLMIRAVVASGGSNCAFSISPSNQSFSASGGNGSVNVTTQSGCAWTATKTDTWITINSGSTGSGNGTVNYTVAPNTGTSQRTGTLTIAGQTFTVTQAGTGGSGTTEVLSTDDGTAEGGFVSIGGVTNGIIYVNRLTPSTYPVTLQTIRIFFWKFSDQPSPTGAQIRLLAFAGSPGTNRPLNNPSLLFTQMVTIPTIPASGGFIDFPITNGPTLNAGDFYIGFQCPSPAAGVAAWFDSNGPQQQRGFASIDNGATYGGPIVVFVDQQGNTAPVNLMIRAVVSSSGQTSNPIIDVQPNTLSFNNVNTGSSADLSLTVRNTGTASLSVINITSNSARFTVTTATNFSVAPNGQQTVTVRFSPTTAGAQTGTLTISSNDPAHPSVTVSLNGTGITPSIPDIDVQPTSLDFGSVNVGATTDRTLTVRNTGNAALNVTNITSSNARFSIMTATNFTVAANGQQVVTVRFSPNATGTQTSTLTIASNDPDESSVTIQLRGDGTQVSANRIVRIVNTSGSPGGTVKVPIELVAAGHENTVSFTLNYDPAVLSRPRLALGSGALAGSSISTNPLDSQTAQGKIGVLFQSPAGQGLASGTRQLMTVTFDIAAGTNVSTTTLSFDDQVIRRRVVLDDVSIVDAAFTSGSVSINKGYEADIVPRPNGKNDGTVGPEDVTQMARFALGLDTPASGSEFQRADCAPRNSLGDGFIGPEDVTQAARYALRLDPVVAAGGPTSSSTSSISLSVSNQTAASNLGTNADNPRLVRAVNASGNPGGTVSVPIEIVAQGHENTISFTLSYDPAILNSPRLTLGSGALIGSAIATNPINSQTAQGQVGVLLQSPAGQGLEAGTRQVLVVTFNISAATAPTSTTVDFNDQIIRRRVVLDDVTIVDATFTPGTVTINPLDNPAPTLTSLAPTSAIVGGAAFTLTVNGTNFITSSTVKWNGSNRTTTFVDSTKLTASIPASDLVTASTAAVTVFNPLPGGGLSTSLNFQINSACPQITVTPASLPDSAGGIAYNQNLTASGGTAPYSFAVTAGTLPGGLTLSIAGTLAGTPNVAGTFNFTVTATDAKGCKGIRNYTVNITVELGAQTGVLYVLNDNPNGNQIYGYAVNETTGALTLLSGFPIPIGGNGANITNSEQLTIDQANQRLYALNRNSGTVSAYSINATTGALTSLPFSPINLGTGNWATLAVHPSGSPLVIARGNGTQLLSYQITATTATAAVGSPYNTGTAQGVSLSFSQDGNYVYTGGNPNTTTIAGFSVNATTGVLTALTGSPFEAGGLPSAYVTDAAGRLFLANATAGQVRVFTSTNGILTAASGNPFTSGLTEAIQGLLHPNGFYLVADRIGNRVGVYRINGSGNATTLTAITGSPFTAGGTFTDVLALNQAGTLLFAANGDSRNLTAFSINPATGALTALRTQAVNTLGTSGRLTGLAYLLPACQAITLSPTTLPSGTVGIAYNQTISASPTGSYTFAVTSGALPVGLSLNSATGALTGLPTTVGTTSFTITATSSSGCTGSRAYTINIVNTSPSCVAVTLSNSLSGFPGSSLTIPITVGDLTGKNVTGYDFTLTFDPAVITPSSTPTDNAGTLSSNFNITPNTSVAGRITVSAFGTIPLAGAGTLLNLKFNLVGALGACSNLNLPTFAFNEGTPCATISNGQICLRGNAISGKVNYGTSATPKPVPGVMVKAEGTDGSLNLTFTDAAGNYSMTGLGDSSYTITPSKTGAINGISGLDASMVAQHAAGIITLLPNQIIAGDASGNGTLSAFDASLIAQTAAGITNNGLAGTWKFAPPSRTYSTLNGNQTAQNFDAILVGDVTGNWTSVIPPPPPPLSEQASISTHATLSEATTQSTVTLPPVSVVSGATLTVPITTTDLTGLGVNSYDFTLSFDSSVLQLESLPTDNIDTLSSNFTIIVNTNVTGQISVSAFGTAPLTGAGTLLNLKFRVIGTPGATATLNWQSFVFNEGTPIVTSVNGSIVINGHMSTLNGLSPSSVIESGGASTDTRDTKSAKFFTEVLCVPAVKLITNQSGMYRGNSGIKRLMKLRPSFSACSSPPALSSTGSITRTNAPSVRRRVRAS